jgi:hypothetical protein
MKSGLNTPPVPISLRLIVLCARHWNCTWGLKTGAALCIDSCYPGFLQWRRMRFSDLHSSVYVINLVWRYLSFITFFFNRNLLQMNYSFSTYHATTLPCVIYRFKSFKNLHLHPNTEFSGLRFRFTSQRFGMYAVNSMSYHCWDG